MEHFFYVPHKIASVEAIYGGLYYVRDRNINNVKLAHMAHNKREFYFIKSKTRINKNTNIYIYGSPVLRARSAARNNYVASVSGNKLGRVHVDLANG